MFGEGDTLVDQTNVKQSVNCLTCSFGCHYQDDRQQSTNIHQRLERHWLGSIEIPFSTVYFNNKVIHDYLFCFTEQFRWLMLSNDKNVAL